MISDIQLVVFDLGQVLIRVCHNWSDACHNAGFALDVAELAGEKKAKYAEIVRDWDCGLSTPEEFAERVATLGGMDAKQALAATDAFLLGPFPGTAKLLDDLRFSGMKTACLSNTNPTHWRMMHERGGANYCWLDKLDYRFASHLFGKCKPDESVYEHVEQETGVAPQSILFFDDREENLVVARKRGWSATLIDPHDDPAEQVRRELKRHNVHVRDPI